MEKIILTNKITSLQFNVTKKGGFRIFCSLLDMIANTEQCVSLCKPDGNWYRYEHYNADGAMIQCSFWFRTTI